MIHDLKKQGFSISAIARRLGRDRKTVRRYLEEGIAPPVYGPRDPRPLLLDPYKDSLRERAARYPDLSGKRLLRKIRGLGCKGGTPPSPTIYGRCGRFGSRRSSGVSRLHPSPLAFHGAVDRRLAGEGVAP